MSESISCISSLILESADTLPWRLCTVGLPETLTFPGPWRGQSRRSPTLRLRARHNSDKCSLSACAAAPYPAVIIISLLPVNAKGAGNYGVKTLSSSWIIGRFTATGKYADGK